MGEQPGRSETTIRDHRGLAVRLTGERFAHILEHPEMKGLESAIGDTLRDPAPVVQSVADPAANLYYRWYRATAVGDKYLCVVVKIAEDDAFILTAYLTDRIKRGTIIWTGEP